MSWLGGLLEGVNQYGTGVQNYYINKELMENQQTNQAELNASQMQWLERMSNTAHQREVADLKAAGLNPILSAGGGGSSTPSASAGSAGLAGVSTAKGSIMDAVLKGEQIKNLRAQRNLIDTQTEGSKIDNIVNTAKASVDASGWGKFIYGVQKTLDALGTGIKSAVDVSSMLKGNSGYSSSGRSGYSGSKRRTGFSPEGKIAVDAIN